MKSLISLLLIFSLQSANADMKFKTTRIEKEFSQLYNKNIDLYQIVIFAMYASQSRYKKDLIITEVYRTQKEQDRYYKNKKKFRSPHQDWKAVDIRTFHLETSEIKDLVKTINKRYNSTSRYIPTSFYHGIGLGKHIHIQFKRRKND